MMRVSVLWVTVVCLCVGVGVGVHAAPPSNGAVSSTVLTGNYFTVGANHTSNDANGYVMLVVTNQTNGVMLNGPELQVVANTIVYFSLNDTWPDTDSVAFGLTTSTTVQAVATLPYKAGEPLGLTPTPASLAAGSCTTKSTASPFTTYFSANTWGRNWTIVNGGEVFSPTPCVVQWQVPPYNSSVNAPKYYYFEPSGPSIPRQIHVLDGPAAPTTPSPSGFGTGSGSGSGSGNNNNTTTSPPTSPTPSGTSLPTPTSPSLSSSSSSSSTGSKVPSGAFPSSRVSAWACLVAALATISAAAAC